MAQGIALGGVALVGSPARLFGEEELPQSSLPPAAARSPEGLRPSLRGELITPADPAYDAARKLWNGMIDKRPAAIVRCSGTADVIDTVKFARSNDLAVSVRGGGHNVAGKALHEGALAIDLSTMDGVRVDPKARRARAQGGATWGEFDRETLALNLVTTGGSVSTTGLGGLTLGGGMGWLMRKHGLA
ncbi:MAG: FAD-binding oxidoreductase, partial [Geminicoccales bacterium]